MPSTRRYWPAAEDIVIVCSPQDLEKYKQHFNPAPAQWSAVENKGNLKAILQNLQEQGEKIRYVIQNEPKGLGHAVLQAKDYIDEAFGVILPDDAILNDNLEAVGLKSLVDHYCEGISLARVQVSDEDTKRYGVFDFGEEGFDADSKTQKIGGVVEKPQENAPSNCAIMGRYILPVSIFEVLAEEKVGAGGEIQLTDAIEILIEQGVSAYATEYEGVRLDCGTPEGYATAQSFTNDILYPVNPLQVAKVASPASCLMKKALS